MGLTLHLNVGYVDNHLDWWHAQAENGDGTMTGFRPFGPFETIGERAGALEAEATAALDAAGVQGVLFE